MEQQAVMEVLESLTSSGKKIKMFALIDETTNKVVMPVWSTSAENVAKQFPNHYGIEMTLENSPATENQYWNGKKFTWESGK